VAAGPDGIFVGSNPEFLHKRSVVRDFLAPDRVVTGADDEHAAEIVADLYKAIDTQIILIDPASAETIKNAANGPLAMKISFVNAVAAMCEAIGADVADVVEGVGLDSRIGSLFLRPGPGWGGSCFPKDSCALVKISEEHGNDFAMMQGVIDVNTEQRVRMIDKVARAVGRQRSNLSGITVGAVSLTFKVATDALRESPALVIFDELRAGGARVRAFVSTTIGPITSNRASLLSGIELVDDLLGVTDDADVVCVLTEWPEFDQIDVGQFVIRGRPCISIFDMRNLLSSEIVRSAGLGYDGVGRL
jgi:UDPglucose 6-dehydrogenase